MMIEGYMFFALGFFAASLLTLIIVPHAGCNRPACGLAVGDRGRESI
jgi:hypothetical protein